MVVGVLGVGLLPQDVIHVLAKDQVQPPLQALLIKRKKYSIIL